MKPKILQELDEVNTQLAEKANNVDNTRLTTSKDVTGAVNELFTSVSEGKKRISAALSDKNIRSTSSDSFEKMSNDIGKIKNIDEFKMLLINNMNPVQVWGL